MLNRLRDKRGAAMESAILFLLVIFLLCFLLTLVALGGHANTKLAEAKLENRLKLDGIADAFLANPATYADTNDTDGYTAETVWAGDVCTLTVTVATPAAPADPEAPPPPVLLTVQVQVGADAAGNPTKTVLAYRYGAL